MSDVMSFPESFKEFIKEYSFRDVNEVYTNGAELVPVFRVEQGIEHYLKESDISTSHKPNNEEMALQLTYMWARSRSYNLNMDDLLHVYNKALKGVNKETKGE